MKIKLATLVCALLISNAVYAEQGWSGYHTIDVIDSLPSERAAFISLNNYTNSICSGHRILLEGATDSKFNQLFSMVLSAFHSGARVNFLLGNDNDCKTHRVLLAK